MGSSETTSTGQARELGARVVRDEARALDLMADLLDEHFDRAVDTLIASRGRLIVTGLGKSGHVARKIAATLTSTGTAAIFMHPVEAMHGDLGVVTTDDDLLVLSKSGKTEEIAKMVAVFKQLGGKVIAVTEGRETPLGLVADIVLLLAPVEEACPLNLAPTSSTTMMLAMGDALAMALLDRRGFKASDFAQFHPDGTLGVGALLRAEDLMHRDDALPVVALQSDFGLLLETMTAKSLGMACVVDESGRLAGALTDGDLRRLIQRSTNVMALTVAEALALSSRVPGTPHKPLTVRPETMAITCRQIMKSNMVTALIATDEKDAPVGVVRMHDLLAAGLG